MLSPIMPVDRDVCIMHEPLCIIPMDGKITFMTYECCLKVDGRSMIIVKFQLNAIRNNVGFALPMYSIIRNAAASNEMYITHVNSRIIIKITRKMNLSVF